MTTPRLQNRAVGVFFTSCPSTRVKWLPKSDGNDGEMVGLNFLAKGEGSGGEKVKEGKKQLFDSKKGWVLSKLNKKGGQIRERVS